MNDERSENKTVKPTLLERLSAFLTREPEDREELLELLHGAFEQTRARGIVHSGPVDSSV